MKSLPSSLGARQTHDELTRGTLKRAPRVSACAALFLAALIQSSPVPAQKVRITNIPDVDFGLLSNLQADSRRSQNICLYSTGTYSVSAIGSGSGSAFTLSNGSNSLAYEVEWSDQSGQPNGSSLAPNVSQTGRTSSATHQFCNSGPTSSASLIIVLRATELSKALEGSYTGSLTLLIAAE
jgi:hypothetical protein